MKMHTFFLSGKAIAIVSGALGAGGVLLFASGVLVGVRVQLGGTAAPTRRVAVAPSAAASTVAAHPADPDASAGAPSVPAPSAPATAAWPFTASSYSPAANGTISPADTPAPTTDAAPVQTPAPAPRDTARRPSQQGQISLIAYEPNGATAQAAQVAPMSTADVPARDGGRYLVQVGTFRVEQHARELVSRLESAGYHASISERQEGDHSLHVVRVSGFVGVDAAEQAAAKIGGAEQLVAYVVPVAR